MPLKEAAAMLPYKKAIIPFAKALRREMTPQERRLWHDFLRNHPVRFQRQKTILGYIVDFYAAKAKLAVEIDGGQHMTKEGAEYDAIRDEALQSLDIFTLRFSNAEIDKDFPIVCDKIDATLRKRPHHDQGLG
jgi:Uncharacterized protein conserved in bacteria